jgi:lysophospholipase L1-like esterase
MKIDLSIGINAELCNDSAEKNVQNVAVNFKKEWLEKLWKGNAVYDEVLCFLYDKDGNIKGGRLLYKPEKILSVVSQSGETIFVEGQDYIVTEQGIALTENSRIPVAKFDEYCPEIKDESCRWVQAAEDDTRYFLPDGAMFRFQVNVTYTHTDEWQGVVPEEQAEKLSRVNKKLAEKKPFEILFYGDSITAGWEASGCDEHAINVDTVEEMHVRLNHFPYLPAWAELVRSELSRAYGYDETEGAKVTKINRAAGGSTADWGVRNAEKLLSPYKPDLAIIGFGMNDNAKDETVYAGEVEAIIGKIREYSPEADVILVSPMVPNEDILCFKTGRIRLYEKALTAVASRLENVAVAPVNSVFQYLRDRKHYYDLTGNFINHPNDFSVRVYAQTVLAVLGL